MGFHPTMIVVTLMQHGAFQLVEMQLYKQTVHKNKIVRKEGIQTNQGFQLSADELTSGCENAN